MRKSAYMLFFFFISAFLICRNMFYIAFSDTVTNDEMQPRNPDVQAPPTARYFAFLEKMVHQEELEVPKHLKLEMNKTLDGKMVDEHNKNHTLLKANMKEVGVIVDQIRAKPRHFEPDANAVHPHPFKYIINSLDICGTDPVFLLIYVHTAPDHYKRRQVIRQTWGNIRQYSDVIRVVFVMGVANVSRNASKPLQDALYFEHEQYMDIVQEDFLDTYHNLTYKGVAALKWISLNCRQAVFLLKTDDDIFVNMYSLLRHMKQMSKNPSNLKGLLMCAVWYGMPVMRTGKWKVTEDEWKDDYYPTYCSGSAFILSTDVAVVLHEVSYHVPFFWVDDFYITGLLPLKAGNITHRQFLSAYMLNGDRLEEIFTGPTWFYYIFSHLHQLDRIQIVWKTMTRLANGELMVTIDKVLPGQLPFEHVDKT